MATACNPISTTSSWRLIGVLVLLRYQGGPVKYQARPRAVTSPAVTGNVLRALAPRAVGRAAYRSR